MESPLQTKQKQQSQNVNTHAKLNAQPILQTKKATDVINVALFSIFHIVCEIKAFVVGGVGSYLSQEVINISILWYFPLECRVNLLLCDKLVNHPDKT